MPNIPKSKIPAYARACRAEFLDKCQKMLKEEEERWRMYAGGDKQWKREEIDQRTSEFRPWLTDNRLKAAVDQVEGDVRANPPGPQVVPAGDGADEDLAWIHAGLLREMVHRSHSKMAYPIMVRSLAVAGRSFIELSTEYQHDKTDAQWLCLTGAPDNGVYFTDPNARRVDHSDAMWQGKIRMLSREQYIAQYGEREITKGSFAAKAAGFMQDFIGMSPTTNMKTLLDWTGNNGQGPYAVCEFALKETVKKKLHKHSDNIHRFHDEELEPNETTGKKPTQGEFLREVQTTQIKIYTCDAYSVLDETEWLGTRFPAIPVLGQEFYIDGERFIQSLISQGMDPQRALNYALTTCAEIIGLIPKAPYLGPEGTFRDPNWAEANRKIFPFLQYKPIMVTSSVTGQETMAPPPARQSQGAELQGIMQFIMYCINAIESNTGVYADRLGATKGDKSGTAISQLQSQSSNGTFYVVDSFHQALGIAFEEAVLINQQIRNRREVATIMQADNKHELATINATFPDSVDPANPNSRRATKARYLNQGRFSVSVTVGPDPQTLKEQTSMILVEFLKIDPEILKVPGVAAKALRSVAQGDPEVEAIADMMENNANNPAALQQQLQQAGQQNAHLTIIVKKLQEALSAKLPQVEADKFKALLDADTKIKVAEINASKDTDNATADRLADFLENQMGLAHEVALQKDQQEHEKGLAAQQHAQALAQGEQQNLNQMTQNQQSADLAPEPAEGGE